MGQKANPHGLRLQLNKNWTSRWFSANEYPNILLEDLIIKEEIRKKLGRGASIQKIEIERSAQKIKFFIYTAKPGIIIGRSGQGIVQLNEFIKKQLEKIRRNKRNHWSKPAKSKKEITEKINLEIMEIRDMEIHASLMAQHIASQLEKRVAYRRAIKQALSKISQKAKGVKISVSGRLNGVEIARREKFTEGSIPLSTFKSKIDYASENAYTTYGVIGIKVWIYTG